MRNGKKNMIFQSVEKSILPAYAGFEITFLPRASRGKKHFYPHKCASDGFALRKAASRQIVRAGRMFGGKVPAGLFRRSHFSTRRKSVCRFTQICAQNARVFVKIGKKRKELSGCCCMIAGFVIYLECTFARETARGNKRFGAWYHKVSE